jgi:hypothetical protein
MKNHRQHSLLTTAHHTQITNYATISESACFANWLTAAAGNFLLAGHSCPEHGRGAADSTIDNDRAGRAINLAGAALHAIIRAHRYDLVAVQGKNRMRTDINTHAAPVTQLGVEL